MVLVFLLLAILGILSIIGILILSSKIRIELKKVEISNINKQSYYMLQISWYIFYKIKVFQKQWDPPKLKKVWTKLKRHKIDLEKIERNIPMNKQLELFKKLKLQVKQFNLELEIGTEDALITSFLVFFLSNLLALTLPHIIQAKQAEQYHYKIIPSYINQNLYKISFNCIIDVKMVHIIHIIYILLKKGISDKHERTSNRRSYDYSYE